MTGRWASLLPRLSLAGAVYASRFQKIRKGQHLNGCLEDATFLWLVINESCDAEGNVKCLRRFVLSRLVSSRLSCDRSAAARKSLKLEDVALMD